jgi:hypothetical protein
MASVIGFVGVVGWPQYDLSRECRLALEQGGSECVDALLLIVMDEEAGYRERNNAIERLGQLRDVRALPVLQGLYAGPSREPASLDDGLSQRLLAETIEALGGEPTVHPLVWGRGTATGSPTAGLTP